VRGKAAVRVFEPAKALVRWQPLPLPTVARPFESGKRPTIRHWGSRPVKRDPHASGIVTRWENRHWELLPDITYSGSQMFRVPYGVKLSNCPDSGGGSMSEVDVTPVRPVTRPER
jgi:hypothetical protein